MKLVKLENGNVEYRTDADEFVWSMPALPTEIKPVEALQHVKLFQSDSRVEYIELDELTSTQVLPAAEIPFAGTLDDLAKLLSSDFFFVVSGGNGTSVETFEYEGETIDAATFAAPDLTPADGEVLAVEAVFTGRTLTNFQYFAKRTRSCSKSGASVIFTTSSSVFTNNTIGTASTCQVTTVPGVGLRAQCTGIAGQTFKWKITLYVYKRSIS